MEMTSWLISRRRDFNTSKFRSNRSVLPFAAMNARWLSILHGGRGVAVPGGTGIKLAYHVGIACTRQIDI